jgi:protein-tyrosine phosphatase
MSGHPSHGGADPVSVLFMCLGNHCRSPAALAVAETMRAGRPFARFDSAGTSRAHVGDRPHPLASVEGRARGYRVDHIGRQIHPDDFEQFDLVIAMDGENVADLERLRGGVDLRRGPYRDVEPVQIQRIRRWDAYAMPGDEDLPDPWGQTIDAYRAMYDVLERTIPALLDHLAWLYSERS